MADVEVVVDVEVVADIEVVADVVPKSQTPTQNRELMQVLLRMVRSHKLERRARERKNTLILLLLPHPPRHDPGKH